MRDLDGNKEKSFLCEDTHPTTQEGSAAYLLGGWMNTEHLRQILENPF